MRRLLEDRRILGGLACDLAHRLDERVERLLRLGLGRLDHQRLGHDEREVSETVGGCTP